MIQHHIGKMLDEEKTETMDGACYWKVQMKSGLPDDPEFRSALVGYLEWGSRIAVINSEETVNPIDTNEPMPKWGWGETGGPYIPK